MVIGILMVILLTAINGNWWLLMVIDDYSISGYFINGCWCLLVAFFYFKLYDDY
jgi:hypothetical protein